MKEMQKGGNDKKNHRQVTRSSKGMKHLYGKGRKRDRSMKISYDVKQWSINGFKDEWK